jgi:hypothetical protein
VVENVWEVAPDAGSLTLPEGVSTEKYSAADTLHREFGGNIERSVSVR